MTKPLPPRRARIVGRTVYAERLSRTAKVRQHYLPAFCEEYHSRKAARYAADVYVETGVALLHDEVKRIFQKLKQKPKPALSEPVRPARSVGQHFYQQEFGL